jgi:chemotaxis protein histidine kinase CheA
MSKEIAIQNKKLIIDIKKTWESALIDSKSAMKKAILTGELLTKLKENTPYGQWENVLNVAFGDTFGRFHAAKLMRISTNKILIGIAAGNEVLTINEMAKLVSNATPEQLEKVEQLKAEEEQKRINAEADKAAKSTANKKQPEIIEGEFVEVLAQEKKSEPKIELKKEEVKYGFVQIDAKELENIEDNMHELASLNKSISKDNDSMSRVFDSNDKLAAAVKEIARLNSLNTSLEGRLNGFMNERNALIKEAKYWRARFEKLEKLAVENG